MAGIKEILEKSETESLLAIQNEIYRVIVGWYLEVGNVVSWNAKRKCTNHSTNDQCVKQKVVEMKKCHVNEFWSKQAKDTNSKGVSSLKQSTQSKTVTQCHRVQSNPLHNKTPQPPTALL